MVSEIVKMLIISSEMVKMDQYDVRDGQDGSI